VRTRLLYGYKFFHNVVFCAFDHQRGRSLVGSDEGIMESTLYMVEMADNRMSYTMEFEHFF